MEELWGEDLTSIGEYLCPGARGGKLGVLRLQHEDGSMCTVFKCPSLKSLWRGAYVVIPILQTK